MTEQLFFELIRVAIGTQATISRLPSETEWEELFKMAVKQSLVGVSFSGLHDLGADSDDGFARIGMNEDLFFDWMGMAAQITMKNEMVNQQCVTLGNKLQKAGFDYVIMKGQEVGRYYNNLSNYADSSRLSQFRQSGDIDVWITNKSRKEVIEYADMVAPTKEINHHHLHFHVFEDTEVELHFIPIELHCPWYDRSLRKFMRSQVKNFAMCEDGYMVPTVEFDLLHQLAHSFRHLYGDGIGMRQIMDFFFTLQEALKHNDIDWTAVSSSIEAAGMKRFAEAMLWILGEVFGMSSSKLYTYSSKLRIEPKEELGRFLLNEVMFAGNFGHTDERINRGIHESPWHRFWRVNRQNIKLMRFSVLEVISTPLWRIVNFLWMQYHGYGMVKK